MAIILIASLISFLFSKANSVNLKFGINFNFMLNAFG